MARALTLISISILTLFIASCSEQKTADEDALGNVPFTRNGSMDTSIVIIQKSTDLCDWRSAQKAINVPMEDHGIVPVHFYHGLLDTNLTISISEITDLQRAEAFVQSDELMNALHQVTQNDGVLIHFLDQQLQYTEDSKDTIAHLMSFKTLAYARWEEAFLDDYRENPEHDFEVIRVFRGLEERDQVYMLFKVNDPQYVEKMEKNNSFRMKMLASGVVSYPVTYKLLDLEV